MAGYIELHSKIQGHVISEGGALDCISPQYRLPTSETLKLFNDIFDSVIRTVVNKKRLHKDSEGTNVNRDSSLHHTFWPEAIKKT